jgi:membrane associated rhomboid family serine protease
VIPLRDRNPTRRTPIVTIGLIVACFAAFGLELSVTASGGDAALERFFEHWGAVPARITAALESGDYFGPATLGMITSMFLHGGWLHILGNMLYLWIFGNNVEDRLGRIPFLVFYLVGGITAALTQVVIDPQSEVPLVGASGAIAAALGCYVVLFPGARILSLVFLGFFYQLLEVPALVILGFWFVLQLISGAAALGATTASGGTAFFAHIGGFVLGVVVGLLLRLVGGGYGARATPAGPDGIIEA